jgi:hypothetical protein
MEGAQMRSTLAILAAASALLVGATEAFAAGDGTFTPADASPFGAGSTPDSIATADFDQDGDLDLAVANRDSADVTVLLGDGTGSFAAVATLALTTDGRPTSIVTGNFNGDADPDLAVADVHNNEVVIFTGGSGATFATAKISVPQLPSRLAVADFNRDTNEDLAVITGGNSRVSILKGAGNSTFPGPATTTTAGDSPSALAAGDFNDDGAPDVAVTSLLLNTVTVLIGDGAGGMTRQTDQPATGTSPLGIVAGDFNGDKDPDLATANSVSDDVSVFAGQLGPGFAPSATTSVGDGPSSVAIGDFNGDGDPDLAVTNQASGSAAGSVSVLLGGTGLTFAAATGGPFAVGAEPLDLTVGDFNGDSIQDIATADGGADSVSVLLGNAAATPPPPPGGGDNQPPQTSIDKGPNGKTSKTKAKIRYSANEPSTFECRLKGKGVDQGDGKFYPCGRAKIKFKHLAPGKKKFQVRATDAAGNVDPTPAKLKWKIVR